MIIKAVILTMIFISLYAYRNWFFSLLGLIVMMAVIEHPDMPKSLGGIQGMNLWNLVLLNVVVAWSIQRRSEGSVWDLPSGVNILLLLYLVAVLASFFRAYNDFSYMPYMTVKDYISEELINTLKWVVPGLLVFDGCRNRKRFYLAIAAILTIYVLLSLQVVRWMPLQYALSGDQLEARSRKIIQNEIGYSRVNMSMMLSGASWAFLTLLPLAKNKKHQILLYGGFFLVAYGQALTGGRMGYITWGIVGLILCLLRWRRYLLFIPVFAIFVSFVFPGVVERMLEGFGQTSASGKTYVSDYEVTAGRTFMWPYVLEKIGQNPLVGYGRHAMRRTGLEHYLVTQYNESFPHPHNAYLELLFDNGLLGAVMILPFYLLMVIWSLKLFYDDSNPLYVVTGGLALAFILSLLVAGMGSQSFYPREGAVGMWCVIGLLMRLKVQRDKVLALQYQRLPNWSMSRLAMGS
ncbi:MAG: O-antigen ligase family protein [Phycisphaerae bacterium]|nr:O-antigen ligase family protein [Phycisphaerae bacterium]